MSIRITLKKFPPKIRYYIEHRDPEHIRYDTVSLMAGIDLVEGEAYGMVRFIFTPKRGSWLNLIESFFNRMARTIIRGIRVISKDELKDRILKYLREVNENPVVFCWKKFEFEDQMEAGKNAA